MERGRQFGPLYHATSAESAEKIQREGYRTDAGSNTHLLSHGPGVYTFSDHLTAAAYASEDHGDNGAVVHGYVHNPKVYEVPDHEAEALKHAKWDNRADHIAAWHEGVRNQGYNVASTQIGYEKAHVVLDPKAFRVSRVEKLR